MTAIQLLEKLGAQKNFTAEQLSSDELQSIDSLIDEKSHFMAIMTNEPAEDEPDDEPEQEPSKQEINKLN
jgi:ribosomal protein S13